MLSTDWLISRAPLITCEEMAVIAVVAFEIVFTSNVCLLTASAVTLNVADRSTAAVLARLVD